MEDEITTLHSHSLIDKYPINYEKFPNSRNVKFYEIELNAGDFLVIPKRWLHWVDSEPNTIAISYLIHDIKKVFSNDEIISSILDSQFYKGNIKVDFDFNKFISEKYNERFEVFISEDMDLSPVIKDNKFKEKINDVKLKNIISYINNNKHLYFYIGMNNIERDDPFYKIPNFDDLDYHSCFQYRTFLWINFNKSINSGLHYDSKDNILHVLHGKKRVLLSSPYNIPFLYIIPFNIIKKGDYNKIIKI